MEEKKETFCFGRSAKQGRWGFVFLGFFINLFMGTNFSWSIFRKPLEADFGIGATLSGLPYTIFFFCFVVNMLISSRFVNKLSPRFVFMVGSILIGTGWIASSFGTNIVWICVTYGLIAGSGAGMAYGVPISVTSRWFPGKTGLALGLTLAGYGLSPVLVAPAANALIAIYGFSTAFLVIGSMALVTLLICSIPLRFPPDEFTKEYSVEAASNNNVAIDTKLTPFHIKTERRFRGLYFGYFIAALSGPMAIGIASPAGQELIGLSAAQAAAFIPLFAVANGFGRTMFGWLSDAITPRFAAAISFLLVLLACGGMLIAENGDLLLFLVSFCFFWMTMGGWIAMAPSITSSFFGRLHQTENYGLVFTAYGFGGIIGILSSGVIKDILGSYRMVFYPMGVLAVIGIMVAFTLSPLAPRIKREGL
jgi:MFS family permease